MKKLLFVLVLLALLLSPGLALAKTNSNKNISRWQTKSHAVYLKSVNQINTIIFYANKSTKLDAETRQSLIKTMNDSIAQLTQADQAITQSTNIKDVVSGAHAFSKSYKVLVKAAKQAIHRF